MKIFLNKSLFVFFLALILFKLTIGKLINNYEKKVEAISSTEFINETKNKIREEMKELLLQRIISRKNRVAASDEFVLEDRDYTKEDDIMIGVW